MTSKKIHEVKPREQSATDDRYGYQHSQTAYESFVLLEDDDAICLYCEWHDDFVTEYKGSANLYVFCQVKSRTLSKGPWTVNAFFGVPKAKTDKISHDSVFVKMLEHHKNFSTLCRSFQFITNNGINDEFTGLIEDVAASSDVASIPKASKAAFLKIAKRYETDLGVDEASLFVLLKKIVLKPEQGHLSLHKDMLRVEVENKVREYSEVELSIPEAKRITDNLVNLIKDRANAKITSIPAQEDKLRQDKALFAENILDTLALSKDGFNSLKQNKQTGKQRLLTLSRLQRLCAKHGFPPEYTRFVCDLKVKWDLWYLNHKYSLGDDDFEALRTSCTMVIVRNLPISGWAPEANRIATEFNGKITGNLHVSEELIMGLLFALVAETGG